MPVTRPASTEPSANGEMLNRVQQLRLSNVSGDVKSAGGGGTSWLPWVLALFLAITWAGIGIKEYKGQGNIRQALTKNGTDATNPNANPNAPGTSGSSTSANAAAAPGTVVIAQKGTLIPTQQIAVSPIEVQGRLVELNIVEGKLFKKGEVLAKIDDVSYLAQYEESKASMAGTKKKLEMAKLRHAAMDPKSVRKIETDQAKAQLDEAKSQQFRAREEFERLNTVSKTGGALSTRELQQADADLRSAGRELPKQIQTREARLPLVCNICLRHG